ncbi:MAG: endoribonuclease YicC domain-containing protein [Planctomycetota bacterium]
MTGYKILQKAYKNLVFQFICKSLNHRFLFVDLKIPDNLLPLEDAIYNKIASRIKRGKILFQITINQPYDNVIGLDISKIRKVLEYLSQKGLKITDLSLTDILQFSHLTKQPLLQLNSSLKSFVLSAVDEIIIDIIEYKCVEGKKMKKIISSLVASIEKITAKIRRELPSLQKKREKIFFTRLIQLNKKLKDKGIIRDIQNENTGLTYFIQKSQFEELKRFDIHVQHFKKSLEKNVNGKELDFLCQEMHREITTLLNKAEDAKISQMGIKIKKHIEDVREILNNIE